MRVSTKTTLLLHLLAASISGALATPAKPKHTTTTTTTKLLTTTVMITATATATATVTTPITTTETHTVTELSTTTRACSTQTSTLSNGNFESPFIAWGAGSNWIPLTSSPGDSHISRAPLPASDTPDGSATVLSLRISESNPNLTQRVLQAVNVCPGGQYRVTYWVRTTTATEGAGEAVVVVLVDGVAESVVRATGEWVWVESEVWVAPGAGGGGVVPVVVRFEVGFTGGEGLAKEVQLDGVVLERMA